MRMRGKLPIFGAKDTWSLYSTLAPIVSAGLKKFKEKTSKSEFGGFPCGFASPEEWYEVLDKMIFAFEHVGEDFPISDEYWEETTGLCIIDKLNHPSLKTPERVKMWEDHIKGAEVQQLRIQEGLDLFARYFQNLWW